MYKQFTMFAVDTTYGEGDYNVNTYNTTDSQGTSTQADSFLPNTGQDVVMVTGLGLIIIAISLFALLRRKKPNIPPKIDS